jgi:hypothetical protein
VLAAVAVPIQYFVRVSKLHSVLAESALSATVLVTIPYFAQPETEAALVTTHNSVLAGQFAMVLMTKHNIVVAESANFAAQHFQVLILCIR